MVLRTGVWCEKGSVGKGTKEIFKDDAREKYIALYLVYM